jgi:predicted Kef-type K+ transport protein
LLAEFGVILLLFIIGIELSVIAFLRVLRPAVIATFGQICCFILLALSVNAYFTWTLPQILLIGFILTLSLTAVALMGIVRAWPEPRTTHAGSLPLECWWRRISRLRRCWFLRNRPPMCFSNGHYCWCEW